MKSQGRPKGQLERWNIAYDVNDEDDDGGGGSGGGCVGETGAGCHMV